MFLEIVIGLHLAVEVSVVDCAITDMVTADRNIDDKVVRAIKTKVHKLDIALLVACGRRRRAEMSAKHIFFKFTAAIA